MTTKFISCFPQVLSHSVMFMLEAMTYRVTIGTSASFEDDVIVEVWTNQCHSGSVGGDWHGIGLELLEVCTENPDHVVFGKSVIITHVRDFKFTFRMKSQMAPEEYIWISGWQEDGFCHVEPPRDGDKWTLGPDFDHITGALYCGNFIAATNAAQCGLTHVLNVADNLDMVYLDSDKVTYKKIPLMDGSANHIPDHLLLEAIDWIKVHDNPENRLLVNCRAGIGRAGSVTVAYVFATNKEMTYEEAYDHVIKKRFVYMHVGLKDSVYRLFR